MFEWLAIIVGFILVQRLRSRLGDVEREVRDLRDTVAQLRARLDVRPREEPKHVAAEPAAPTPTVAATPSVLEPLAPARAAPPVSPTPARTVADEGREAEEARRAAAARREAAAAARERAPEVPPTRPPALPPLPPPPPATPRPAFDWEGLIGVKLFSWIAGVALLIAGVLFLRYSMDHGWLRPEIRMAIGFLTAIALLVACELRVARGYAHTANAMDAAGIGLLFATTFASYALWQLIPAVAATALFLMTTGVAVLLSIRRDSMLIALLGLLGGFATPAVLSTGRDDPFALFGYLLLLNAGLAWVAYRKRWPALTALSAVFSTLYQWGWVVKFLTPAKLPTAVAVFLLFPILSVVALAIGGTTLPHTADDEGRSSRASSLFAMTARASAALPLAFALYLAIVPSYGSHYALLFGFLFCVVAGLFVVSLFQGPHLLHALGAGITVATFAVWFQASYTPQAYPAVVAFTALFAALYLTAPRIARRWRATTLDELGGRAVYAAPLLLFVFPVLCAIEPRTASPTIPFVLLFVLLAACAAVAMAERAGVLYYIGAFFAVAAEAVWSSRYLNPDSLYTALALYAVFGLFYLGVPFIARRRGRPLEPAVAPGVLTLASLALLVVVPSGPGAESALWGMALLIALLNAGLYLESAAVRMPALSIAGAALSWLVLGGWWLTTGASVVLPALVVMGGFATLTMVGSAWARGQVGSSGNAVQGFDANVFMGLVGHVFVAFVATRPELSLPPWPIFGALAVLDLACLAIALYLRTGILHAAAIVATAVVLMLWLATGAGAPWPDVGVVAAAATSALAFAAIPLARRVRAPSAPFELAAGVSALLAQTVIVVAQLQPGRPTVAFLLVAELLFVAGALGLTSLDPARLGWIAIAAVVPAGVSAALFQLQHTEVADWRAQLLLTTPVLLAFTVYPLLLGRRGSSERNPSVAAVLAHVVFFFLARRSLLSGELQRYMGALPIAQGLLLLPLLARNVRTERERLAVSANAGQRQASDQLALVAAATLACLTVAIPLQLDKNWITIGWAFEGAALLWLVRRVRHPGLILSGIALLVTAFARLTLNPAVLTYHPRGAMPILNWYLYTYLLVAGALFVAARLVDERDTPTRRLDGVFAGAGAFLLFLLLNIEIADFYATGPTLTFHFSATLAQDLTYTIGWGVFALGLLTAGIALRNRPCRIASIVLLVLTVCKCFLHDLGRLGGLYRVGSFVGLAVCLALVAIVLQRFVLARDETVMGTA
jgi:uncharacterized membrane protein